MLGDLKRLGRETLIYGLSTVVGRLLNFLLLPFYTHCLSPAEYGVIATAYSGIAFLNVLYSYGMDFAFMRFAGSAQDGETKNFSTSFWSLSASSLVFSAAIYLAAKPLARAAGLPPEFSDVIRYAAWILALDALALVPFAELRLIHRAWAYAGIKVANIAINLVLNYVFLVPMNLGVRGVFLANLAASSATLTMLVPVIARKLEPIFDRDAHRTLLKFGLPLIPAGLASMMVQVIDRPILLAMTDQATVGVYQANHKLGIFMQLIVNMFDAAWRPFFLQRASDPSGKPLMARILTYFVLGSSIIVLGLSLFLPDLVALPLPGAKTLIHPDYWPGLSVVPVILLGYLFNGIYVNLLAPVTLAKRTGYVAYATATGALINIAANLLLVPGMGVMGAATAMLAAYAAMAAVLFALGRKVYPIPYEYGRLARIAACFGLVSALALTTPGFIVRLGLLAALPVLLAATGFLTAEERAALRRLVA